MRMAIGATDLLGWHLRTESIIVRVLHVHHTPPSRQARPPRPRNGCRCRCIACVCPRLCTPTMRAACDGHRCSRSAWLAPADRKHHRACAARSSHSTIAPSTSATPLERLSMSLHRLHTPKVMHAVRVHLPAPTMRATDLLGWHLQTESIIVRVLHVHHAQHAHRAESRRELVSLATPWLVPKGRAESRRVLVSSHALTCTKRADSHYARRGEVTRPLRTIP